MISLYDAMYDYLGKQFGWGKKTYRRMMIWAFGKGYHKIAVGDMPERWNKRHGADLGVPILGTMTIAESMRMIAEAFVCNYGQPDQRAVAELKQLDKINKEATSGGSENSSTLEESNPAAE
jgi:hypothetical protein